MGVLQSTHKRDMLMQMLVCGGHGRAGGDQSGYRSYQVLPDDPFAALTL